MEVNSVQEIKDGDETRSLATEAPSLAKQKSEQSEGNVRKKRRRGKSKRKVMKPFMKMPWPDRKRNDKIKRNNRFRKIVLTKTHAPAPFNNNQFLMEIHKPEPENVHIGQTPSTRTRDSSFSVDSEENYFYSLPEDEEDFLTKEFSSVYEDAQSERLANMSKNELIQEYILLEAKYDTLVKKTDRSRSKQSEDNTSVDRLYSTTDSMITDKDTSSSSVDNSDEITAVDYLQRFKELEDQISELKVANEKLLHENEVLRQKSQCSSSEDSESDSSSTSISCSSSSQGDSPHNNPFNEIPSLENHNGLNGQNGTLEDSEVDYTRVNGHGQSDDHNHDEQ